VPTKQLGWTDRSPPLPPYLRTYSRCHGHHITPAARLLAAGFPSPFLFYPRRSPLRFYQTVSWNSSVRLRYGYKSARRIASPAIGLDSYWIDPAYCQSSTPDFIGFRLDYMHADRSSKAGRGCGFYIGTQSHISFNFSLQSTIFLPLLFACICSPRVILWNLFTVTFEFAKECSTSLYWWMLFIHYTNCRQEK
jgi:hypothetical protein